LGRRRLEDVDAVTAAGWLSEEDLLPDNGQRPGLPLRRLLRERRIEGAEQRPDAPHGRWFIVRVPDQGTEQQREDDVPDAAIGASPDDETTSVSRNGDPEEFDEVLEGEIADADLDGKLQIPPGLVRQLLASPAHAPELLAMRAVEQFADRAERDVRLLRERNPDVSDRQLAVYFKKKYSRAAGWEGAAGIFGLPADLALLAWIQNRMVLSIAATYGHDMTDHKERGAELLMVQGVHVGREAARRGLEGAAKKAAAKLIVRHLRKDALILVKQLFKTVGITFTRKALLEKGIPLLSVPISASVNHVSTRLLANQAIKFYDTDIS